MGENAPKRRRTHTVPIEKPPWAKLFCIATAVRNHAMRRVGKSSDFVKVSLLPDDWFLAKYIIAAAAIAIIVFVEKKLGRAK